jgi:outer membrane protein assembly factor BamB
LKNRRIGFVIGLVVAMLALTVMAAPAMAADWPQFHYDETNIGFSPLKAPNTNETLWISEDIGAVAGSSTVVAENKVFVYSNDTLKALDEFSGAELWSVPIPPPTWGSWHSPSYHDGCVFITAGTNVYCRYASNGSEKWTWAIPSGKESCNGGTTVVDGKVVVGDWDGHHYYCIDEATGTTLLWTFDVDGNAQGTPTYANGNFYLTSYVWTVGGNIYSVNASNGIKNWNQTTPIYTCGSAAVANGIVYVTTYNFYGAGDIYAMDATDGSILWQQTIQRSDSTPAIAYGNVYVTGGYSDVQTYCFNAITGDLVWDTDTSDEIGDWISSVAVADGKVFVGHSFLDWSTFTTDYDGTYALDASTGDVIWSYPEGGSSPAVAGNIVFTIGGGRVYAFGKTASVIIKPETLNLNAKGDFTAFITLLECYDVADINISTVECEGAPALSGTISDDDSDMLVVKFHRADLLGVPTGDAVEMTVTGELTDGTKFDGSDTVRVIAKGA